MAHITNADFKRFAKMSESEAKKYLAGLSDDDVTELSTDQNFVLWDALEMSGDEQDTVNKLMDIVDDVPYGFYRDNSVDTLNDWLGANGRLRVTDKVKRMMLAAEEQAERWRVLVDSPESDDEDEPEMTLSQVLALYEGDDEWDATGMAAQKAADKKK